jgi:hypothetical protein
MRAILVCLVLTGLLLSCASALASSPLDYSMTTEYRNPDGTVFRITRDYVRDGAMHRREYVTPVAYHFEVHVDSEAQLDSDSDEEELTTAGEEEMMTTTVQLPLDIEPHTVDISRNDLGIGWMLDTESLTYGEYVLDPAKFEYGVDISLPEDYATLKIGETSVLGYECDVYDVTQTYGETTYTNIITVTTDLSVILRTELLIDGVVFQIAAVTQFSLEKPDESLFVVPAWYSERQEGPSE